MTVLRSHELYYKITCDKIITLQHLHHDLLNKHQINPLMPDGNKNVTHT